MSLTDPSVVEFTHKFWKSNGGGEYLVKVDRKVKITSIQLGCHYGDILEVYFDPKYDGIRPQVQWYMLENNSVFHARVKQLILNHIKNLGHSTLPMNTMCAAESGLQGKNYVSFEVSDKFRKEWSKIFSINFEQ